ncbi:hypothetical protein HanXRQr2_Chr13g0571621 [Helianthus annuus]|uniref:Uncharacterized protein n=2 Tax=Helianthus annuus TaxID=4232 RepID=A0A9K3HB56_HELAN|nr:hypothetical protein HanXRQr2_Chr13g0571621 [Helianthus annuus]KAJ0475702.1 hypothetical protein HanHA300_Chr13g0468601 [Helianthus annuus]KAJ0479661.1 hypothetical protein HanIR_Chr13g0622581 [Helianthus annuus]KAJ0496488.1 hypothetical protein HanHA89_Chr13g0500381 [Helianthus annuus]KAJ0662545.1 hypothetical protein HanLR1_Chr13g0470791 [Helianthus annuus]
MFSSIFQVPYALTSFWSLEMRLTRFKRIEKGFKRVQGPFLPFCETLLYQAHRSVARALRPMPSRYASASSGQKVHFQHLFANSGANLAISLCGNQVTTSPRLCTCIKQMYG